VRRSQPTTRAVTRATGGAHHQTRRPLPHPRQDRPRRRRDLAADQALVAAAAAGDLGAARRRAGSGRARPGEARLAPGAGGRRGDAGAAGGRDRRTGDRRPALDHPGTGLRGEPALLRRGRRRDPGRLPRRAGAPPLDRRPGRRRPDHALLRRPRRRCDPGRRGQQRPDRARPDRLPAGGWGQDRRLAAALFAAGAADEGPPRPAGDQPRRLRLRRRPADHLGLVRHLHLRRAVPARRAPGGAVGHRRRLRRRDPNRRGPDRDRPGDPARLHRLGSRRDRRFCPLHRLPADRELRHRAPDLPLHAPDLLVRRADRRLGRRPTARHRRRPARPPDRRRGAGGRADLAVRHLRLPLQGRRHRPPRKLPLPPFPGPPGRRRRRPGV
ncbi:MAG: hypothetical protein AVDCRST_MAG73-1870, partial [uncultured Thermomicrobiales bacterium]